MMERRFDAWRAAHNRSYATGEEQRRRFEVYRRNVEHIEATNRRGGLSYQLGENQFTDLRSDEFMAAHTIINGSRQLNNDNYSGGNNNSAAFFGPVPYRVDWRSSGAVTPVKHQMGCGSSWAFAAVASIESLYMLRTGRLVSLSEQQVVDCDDTPADSGSRQGPCRRNGGRSLARIRGAVAVQPNSEAALERAVARQPVVVSISAATALQFYKGGVLSGGPCDAGTSHALTLVGYGAAGQAYWIAKNSWGDGWGEGGYVRMERRVQATEGWCGIASKPYYPIMWPASWLAQE
ncbi:unnamed protein product [Urochloa decumbens]|uniref:Uncharacterized protein n=1 Tax=Urochloa decumbens TaxID=240449 RepID=A0ABC9HEY2_9POAL